MFRPGERKVACALIGAFAAAGALVACEDQSAEKKRQDERRAARAEMLRNPDAAMATIRANLTARLIRRNQLTLAVTRPGQVEVIPHFRWWKVTCGLLGLNLVLGHGTASTSDEEDATVTVPLLDGLRDEDECMRLALPSAEVARSVLGAERAAP